MLQRNNQIVFLSRRGQKFYNMHFSAANSDLWLLISNLQSLSHFAVISEITQINGLIHIV